MLVGLVWLLAGCRTVLVGEVRTEGGGPVSGAVLTSPGCEAVTGADGRFRVGCAGGARTFAVTHPEHLPRTWAVTAERWGERDVGFVEVAGVPLGEGLWLASDDRLEALAQAPLALAANAQEQRWCMSGAEGDPRVVPAGRVRLLDNHTVDWRLYRLDAEGCAYRMAKSAGDHWSFTAERVEVTTTPRGPGRDWVELDLTPGDYAVVEWYDGFLVRGDGGFWRSHWLRAGAPSASTPFEPVAPTATQAP